MYIATNKNLTTPFNYISVSGRPPIPYHLLWNSNISEKYDAQKHLEAT
jgi:hypothetical protein